MPLEPWQLFWAKTDRDRRTKEDYDPMWTRPLWAHLLDVGHVAWLLWERVVPDGFRRRAAAALGMTDEQAGGWLSFWIGLHDLGKAIPSFQFQDEHAPYLERMREQGFTLRPPAGMPEKGPHHGHATIAILYRELTRSAEADGLPSFKESLAAFVGFHHGRLLDLEQWRKLVSEETTLGGEDWKRAQRALLHAVHTAWAGRYGLATPAPDLERVPDWLLGLAGWATLADWLGSIAAAFSREVGTDPAAYLDASRAGAEEALRRVGFDAPAALVARPFAELFPELADHDPRPVQQALIDLELPDDPDAPTLVIVEAPTGEGKTEGALALAVRQQDRRGRDRDGDASRGGGFYLALPTQATANGLLKRATDFLAQAHRGPVASFRLAYGRAELHPDAAALVDDAVDEPDDLTALYDEDDGSSAARVRTLRWFLGRKRALLAPYGVGTIDQALLGVLYARHFFLRLFGLAGKTVVVDEVHAYDVYMGELIHRLLPWLRALGAHVVLLSATLPARSRRALLSAWDSGTPLPEEPAPEALGYPAVWTSAEGKVRCQAGEADGLTASRTQECVLERGDSNPDAIARCVAEAVEAGAAVAVVCNTVQRAQDVFEAICTELKGELPPDDLVLFHARFVQRERQRIEALVVGHRDPETGEWVPGRFGKGRAPGPAVLVGTQVIEQSLDLDVDLMFSDLAPVDLLLQRAGRLHRHDRPRPSKHATPRLVWLCPGWDVGALPDVEDLSGHGHVYARRVLWRTARLLRDRPAWSLPTEYRPLIEAVYGTDEVPDDLTREAAERWEKATCNEEDDTVDSVRNARKRRIEHPSELIRMLLVGQPDLADDDDEQAHASLKALTREGESVEVVVLHEGEGGALYLDPACTLLAPLALPAPKKALPAEDVRALLGASVRLSQKSIVTYFRRPDVPVPEAWRMAAEATPSLLGLHPVVMRGGVWSDAGRPVRWHDTLGLVIPPSR